MRALLNGFILDYKILILLSVSSRDSSVGIATATAGRPGFDFQKVSEIFLCYMAFRLDLVPTQPPIQWVPATVSPGVKRLGREADHSPLSSTEVNNGGAIPPLPNTSASRGA
jgi:hypothetical protein